MEEKRLKAGIFKFAGSPSPQHACAVVYRPLALILSLILNPLVFSLSSAADWPTFRGNCARTGYVAEQAGPPLTQAWVVQVAGGIVSSPVVFDDVVYFGTRGSKVYALDARTGAVKTGWPVQTGGWVDAAPSVSSGTVYVSSLDGYLYALNRLTGAVKWKAALGAPSASSPLVYDGRVFVGTSSPQNKLRAFSAASGRPLGGYVAGQPVDSAPAAYGANVYFGANDGKVYAVDRNTLLQPAAWHIFPSYGSYGMNSVALSSGTLYALPGHDDKKVYALDTSSGNETAESLPVEVSDSWENLTSPVVSPDRLYFAGGAVSNSLYALSRADLTSSPWASPRPLGGLSEIGVLSAPAMAGNELYAATNDGRLVSVSSGGIVAPDMPLLSAAYSSPAISNGMVFVGTMGGQLFGFKAGAAAAIASPKADDLVSGTVPVRGYIANPALSGYELDYGSGAEPPSWTLISSAAVSAEIDNGVLGSWDVSALANGIYTLRLSVSPASSDNTVLLTLRVDASPAPPSGLAAADVPGDRGYELQLNWTASTTPGLAAYDIYRSSGGIFKELFSVGSGSSSYVDAAAVTGTTYTYTVRAFDGYAESADSNYAAAFSVDNNPGSDHIPPAAVGDLAAGQGRAGGRAALSWTAAGNDGMIGAASGYVIRYSSNPAFDWNSFDSAALWKSSRPVTGPYGKAEKEEVKGLSGGVTYYFALEAYDDNANYSSTSNVASAWAQTDPAVPGAPPALAVADTPGDHGGSLNLSWTRSPADVAGAGDFYGYKIYRRPQPGFYEPGVPLAAVSAGQTGYVDAAAAENLGFCYTVAAYNSTHDSPDSAEACGVSVNNWRYVDKTQGNTLSLPDGAVVVIPANAASNNDNILITKLDPATYLPESAGKANTGASPTGVVYAIRFENPATTLLKSAVITLPYAASDAAGLDQENLRIYMLSGGAWLLLNTSSVDTQAKKVSAEVVSFSTFSIMAYLPSGPVLAESEVYTYPNPARGDALTFKFLVAYKSDVSVDVYNVAGEKVARLEKTACPAGIPSEISWRTHSIASGVYIYRLEARSAAGKKTIEKKLAIIH